jgi:hexokinase
MSSQKYPNFANRVHTALVDIFGEKGKKIVTHHAEDGSGVGSAIIAGELQPRQSHMIKSLILA